MHQIDAEQLKAAQLFRHASCSHLAMLAEAATFRHFPSKATLFTEGQKPEVLYVLIGGLIELYSVERARRCTIDVFQPVKSFMVAPILSRQRHPISARTLIPSDLVVLPARVVRKLLKTDAGCARDCMNELAADHLGAIEELKKHKLLTGIERLALWILRLDSQMGHKRCFDLPYEKRTLAAFLGMSPENLSRNLAALRRNGVMVRGCHVVLNDPSGLAKMAGTHSMDGFGTGQGLKQTREGRHH